MHRHTVSISVNRSSLAIGKALSLRWSYVLSLFLEKFDYSIAHFHVQRVLVWMIKFYGHII
jgi:hypothetical protein